MSFSELFPALRGFFDAMDATWVANVIKDSRWWFPVIETMHVLAFALLMGTTFLVDLHFFGLSMNRQPVQRIARALWPWTMQGLIWCFITGVLMMVSEAIKSFENQAFMPKMILFLAAVVLQFTIHKRLTMDENSDPSSGMSKMIAILSSVLWTSIFIAGRAIGFV